MALAPSSSPGGESERLPLRLASPLPSAGAPRPAMPSARERDEVDEPRGVRGRLPGRDEQALPAAGDVTPPWRAVRCPTCAAVVGERCKTLDGWRRPRRPHKARREAGEARRRARCAALRE